MVDFKQYKVAGGLYYVPDPVGSVRDSIIARVVSASSGCTLSYEKIRRSLNVPAYDETAGIAFKGAVEALLAVDKVVVLEDREELVYEYMDLFDSKPQNLRNILDIKGVSTW